MQRQPQLPMYSYMYLISASQMLTWAGQVGRERVGEVVWSPGLSDIPLVGSYACCRQPCPLHCYAHPHDPPCPTPHLALLGLLVLVVAQLRLPLEALPILHALVDQTLQGEGQQGGPGRGARKQAPAGSQALSRTPMVSTAALLSSVCAAINTAPAPAPRRVRARRWCRG